MLAVRGEGGVDEPIVQRREFLVADPEPFARGEGEVGDEDVRVADEPVQGASPRLGLEVEGEAALVPVVREPAVVHLAGRVPGGVAEVPEGVPRGRLELDDVRSEVGHHGGCRGRGDEAARVDDLQPGKEWRVVHVPELEGWRGRGCGGAEEDRTPDLRIANATLSRLSYGPGD